MNLYNGCRYNLLVLLVSENNINSTHKNIIEKTLHKSRSYAFRLTVPADGTFLDSNLEKEQDDRSTCTAMLLGSR